MVGRSRDQVLQRAYYPTEYLTLHWFILVGLYDEQFVDRNVLPSFLSILGLTVVREIGVAIFGWREFVSQDNTTTTCARFSVILLC